MSIVPQDPTSKPLIPPTPAGVAELMVRGDHGTFTSEVAGLIGYIAETHQNRCDHCDMLESPCPQIEWANSIAIAWLMEQVQRG